MEIWGIYDYYTGKQIQLFTSEDLANEFKTALEQFDEENGDWSMYDVKPVEVLDAVPTRVTVYHKTVTIEDGTQIVRDYTDSVWSNELDSTWSAGARTETLSEGIKIIASARTVEALDRSVKRMMERVLEHV